MPPPKPVVIACAADARYAMPLAVMLRSAVENLDARAEIEAHVVDDGIGHAGREKIAASLPARATLRWVERPSGEFARMPAWGRMSLTTYHKLTLGEWLPGHVEKAIWLDCDALVLGDLARLWAEPLRGHVVLAAADVVVPQVSSRFGVAAWRDLGLAREARYFNAGIMLIDLARWRREETGQRAFDYLLRHGARVFFWDQEGLNAVLAGRWGELDPRWNWSPAAARLRKIGEPGEPWIIHFSGNLKPWRFRGSSRHHALYADFIARTAWGGWRPARSWRGRALAAYEASRLRSLLYPLEQFHLRLVRLLARR